MSVLVVGSVAYDSVKTPAGSRNDSLGGSAMYFSIASSYFTPVSVVAVVGDDFREEHVRLMKSRGVDVSGLERKPGKTFRWAGVYGAEDVNTRETLDTQLNVFADFSPALTPSQCQSKYLFLANIDPELQLDVLSQMSARPELVALDTMNFWIEGKRSDLLRVVELVDVIFLDEGEARQLSGEPNLLSAAKRIHSMGPRTVIVKRGEHGVMMFNGGSVFVAPAFPLERVVDPTGAGDSFAGGFMGYLAATGDASNEGFRRATVLGCVMGSFAVESFSADRTSSLKKEEVEARFRAFADLTRFSALHKEETLPWRGA
ncbi:MAG: PfkB family carbohydrate kinase [Chloroflexi bacterium]|nr:PfkB family carbohydrate kinase [Chloroflexota bacterium]